MGPRVRFRSRPDPMAVSDLASPRGNSTQSPFSKGEHGPTAGGGASIEFRQSVRISGLAMPSCRSEHSIGSKACSILSTDVAGLAALPRSTRKARFALSVCAMIGSVRWSATTLVEFSAALVTALLRNSRVPFKPFVARLKSNGNFPTSRQSCHQTPPGIPDWCQSRRCGGIGC